MQTVILLKATRTTDPLGHRHANARTINWAVLLLCALAASCAAALHLGTSTLGSHASLSPEQLHTIIRTIRAPRITLAVCVGAGLAVAGAVMQALVRNILADPYIVGIHSGASAGAAAVLLGGSALGAVGAAGAAGTASAAIPALGLQAGAFVGAAVASVLVFALARTAGSLNAVRILLAGVAVGYALSALTSFMVFASDSPESSRSVMFWLLGSLNLARWDSALLACAVVTALCCAVLWCVGPHVDAVVVGDSTALSLGIRPARFRAVLLAVLCVLIGSLVAMSGAIGFVGLVVPHVARRLVGSAHRRMLPIAALLGALLLVWSDVLARLLLAPQEIPIGIITALIGTPGLFILIRRQLSSP
ncbi:iron chelate uptake ABC transporter family permease subunit [Corynebacterium sp. zg254]|uniref:Iron ABC transporter permease n=1 Tax=Corynebacterium zhongnanshanii TaxID=2768834 RepID=A0ABQ6VE27_9CORY|nr:iron ABC transporter permease [Corynebacterium zhongnanshanii]MCR5914249.1 iron chelate uptake ABC transporter family permease subunit [Corynebacterium sp. zg254]